jgi:hypothetical protein
VDLSAGAYGCAVPGGASVAAPRIEAGRALEVTPSGAVERVRVASGRARVWWLRPSSDAKERGAFSTAAALPLQQTSDPEYYL